MTIHNYAIIDDTGVIVNVVVVDDEAVGFDDERGKWEPFHIEEAEAQGWAYLAPEGEPSPAWIGDSAVIEPASPPIKIGPGGKIGGQLTTVAAWTFTPAPVDTRAPVDTQSAVVVDPQSVTPKVGP